jgi:putative transcriptional regulator
MARKAFEMMMEGMGDAIAYAQGDTSRGRVATVDAKAVRAKTKLSQDKFATTYHLPVGTLRDWEQGRAQPDRSAATLLKMIDADAAGVEKILAKVQG